MSALVNATLTKITAPGEADRKGKPTPGDVLWEGRAGGYLKRNRRTQISGGVEVAIRSDVFTILTAAGAPMLAAAGPDWEATTVTIEDRRIPRAPVTRTFRVDEMEHRAAGTSVDSVRLELEELDG